MSHDMWFPDDFPTGGPQGGNRNSDPQRAVNDWQRLTRGRTVGKSANILWNPDNPPTSLNLLEVGGSDDEAMQLSLTVLPPKVFTGSLGNVDIANLQGPFLRPRDTISSFVNPGIEVEWGVGGVSSSAVLDIANGRSVNLGAASFVRVKSQLDQPNLGGGGTTMVYQLSAFIGPSMPKTLGATRTVPTSNLDSGIESDAFPVPNFARRVFLMGGATTPAGAAFVGYINWYRGQTAGGAGDSFMGQTLFAVNSSMPVPVPNGAYFFTILSGVTGAPFTFFNAIFDLSI